MRESPALIESRAFGVRQIPALRPLGWLARGWSDLMACPVPGLLHGLALACGWPGALLAQQILAHKRAKQAFVRRFWLCVALNLLGFTLIFTPLGGELLRRVA